LTLHMNMIPMVLPVSTVYNPMAACETRVRENTQPQQLPCGHQAHTAMIGQLTDKDGAAPLAQLKTPKREGLALHDRLMQHQNVQFADVGARTDAANKGTIFVHDGSKASAVVSGLSCSDSCRSLVCAPCRIGPWRSCWRSWWLCLCQ
jgi:hypothetical protein